MTWVLFIFYCLTRSINCLFWMDWPINCREYLSSCLIAHAYWTTDKSIFQASLIKCLYACAYLSEEFAITRIQFNIWLGSLKFDAPACAIGQLRRLAQHLIGQFITDKQLIEPFGQLCVNTTLPFLVSQVIYWSYSIETITVAIDIYAKSAAVITSKNGLDKLEFVVNRNISMHWSNYFDVKSLNVYACLYMMLAIRLINPSFLQ